MERVEKEVDKTCPTILRGFNFDHEEKLKETRFKQQRKINEEYFSKSA